MLEENELVDVIKDNVGEVVEDIYQDVVQPVAQPAGQLLGLIPRAVKAALSPLEKWILTKEYNIEETRKLLEQKLEKISPELIESPEPHIAVPALQYISYCMDNEELRDMYANLLANSMNKVVKNGVHPGFVEVIKQLCPDEAKILHYIFFVKRTIPTITVRYVDESGSGIDFIKNFSNIGELSGCEKALDINKYFNNLERLGLIECASALETLSNTSLYEPLKKHIFIIEASKDSLVQAQGFNKTKIDESFIELTDYGIDFCEICISE